MSKNLFKEIITDRLAWERQINSQEIINPLLQYIYESNNIKSNAFIKLGSVGNSVYRTGDTVIKIFCPPETKSLNDALACHTESYDAELESLKFCKSLGVNTPDIICNGTIYDTRYTFSYIVMNYIDGIVAEDALDGYTDAQKTDFSLKLKEIADIIHIPTDINIPRYTDPNKIDNGFWNNMPESFREDRKRYLSNIKFPEPVFQHGDFGDCNIIIDEQGELHVIDFSESLIAPYYYEWRNDYNNPVIREAYFSGFEKDELYEIFTTACLIDSFGMPNITRLAHEAGIDYNSITSVNALKNMFVKLITI